MNRQLSILYIFSCLLTVNSFSQVSVSADKMNVFYVGVDNPVSIAVANTSCKDVSVNISNGKITGTNCKYVVRCDSPGICRITVSTIKPKKQAWISEFRVKMIPLPVFRIGPYGRCNSMAMKTIIREQEFVRAELENFDLNLHYNIDSFRIRIIRDTTEIISVINKGNKIENKVHDALTLLTKGDLIIFDNIIVSSPFVSPSLKGFYESKTYDEYGNIVYDKNPKSNDKYLTLKLEQLELRIF